jgi:hypothetical protein
MTAYESTTTPGMLRRAIQADAERSTAAYETTTTRLQSSGLNTCALVEDLLPLYIDGEVSPATHDMMVEHLAQCEHCAGYLAGAQSVRGQLRRDQSARVAVVANDRQAQQAMSSLQRLIYTAMLLGVSMAALLISGALWSEMHGAGQAIGIFLALMSFAVLGLIALRQPTMSMARWALLSAGSILGCISISSIVFTRDYGFGSSPTPFFGLIFTLVSVALIRYALVSKQP